MSRGVPAALRAALAAAPRDQVDSVTVATSWFSDVLATGDELEPVAVLRLAHSDRSVFPPLSGWPEHLRGAVHVGSCVQPGGHDLSGRPLGAPDQEAVLRFARESAEAGARGLAVTAVGAPMVADQEIAVAEVVHRRAPDLPVTLSHEVGGLGLLARENTTVLNAALRPAAERLADAVRAVVDEFLPGVPVLFGRHDAALMNTEYLRRFPVAALAADVAAALRGAGVLAGLDDAVVVEWDGSRGFAGRIETGLPRRGNGFRNPRLSLPLPDLVASGADGAALAAHVRAEPGPVVVLGELPDGLSDARRLADGRWAAAVGAATAQPAAEVDRVLVEPSSGGVDGAVDRVAEEALVRVISAGARPDSARVDGIRTTPVAYLPGNVHRVQVRASGVVQ
ncbi:hydantoinase/oxoprolinase family protein [Saccharopolyspora rosea]